MFLLMLLLLLSWYSHSSYNNRYQMLLLISNIFFLFHIFSIHFASRFFYVALPCCMYISSKKKNWVKFASLLVSLPILPLLPSIVQPIQPTPPTLINTKNQEQLYNHHRSHRHYAHKHWHSCLWWSVHYSFLNTKVISSNYSYTVSVFYVSNGNCNQQNTRLC